MSPLANDTQYLETEKTYNGCDRQVLQTVENLRRGGSKECIEAIPPLNSGDDLATQSFCIYEPHFLSHLVMHQHREEKILDKDENTVVIKNETYTVTTLFFARDKATLEEVLQNTEIQSLRGSVWTTKRALASTEYGEISNLRHYHVTDCGSSFEKARRSLAAAEKLEVIANAGIRVQIAHGSPRPTPEMYLGALSLLRGDPDLSLPGGDPPLMPEGSDERFFQEMVDEAWKKAAKDLEVAATSTVGSCEDKVLPYYWTTVVFQYSPELGETQIRLHVNSTLEGPKDLVVTERFKVYLAAATHFDMPIKDGNRSFSFQLFASEDFLSGINLIRKSVVYNENDLSAEHHADVHTLETYDPWTINDRIVVKTIARGTFPFRKNYDYQLNYVSEVAFSPNDSNPLIVEGGATVAYRLEVEGGSNAPTFVSQPSSFPMPPPLTFALMGDSFSSGQGAPVLDESIPPWINDDCHTSRYSGLYRGVNEFIRQSNKACDYVFVACEGATIQDLVDQAQHADHNPDGTTKPDEIQNIAGIKVTTYKNQKKQDKAQVDLAADWMSGKGYDHVTCTLFSIGGNNSGFADVIEAAMGFAGVDNPSLRRVVDDGIAYINGPDGYSRVDTIVRDKLRVQNIIILGVPDVTHNSDGSVCKTDCRGSTSTLDNTFNESEMQYGAQLQDRLNQAAISAAGIPGWQYVDIFEATKNHGICVCEEMYYNTWDAALSVTGPLRGPCSLGVGALRDFPVTDQFGIPKVLEGASCSFHPTKLGYEQYIKPIVDQLNLLYGD